MYMRLWDVCEAMHTTLFIPLTCRVHPPHLKLLANRFKLKSAIKYHEKVSANDGQNLWLKKIIQCGQHWSWEPIVGYKCRKNETPIDSNLLGHPVCCN